jgi:hypothetical protein
VITASALIASLSVSLVAGASPGPANAEVIASLVAASEKVTTLSVGAQAALSSAPNDLPWIKYGSGGDNGCLTLTQCVYGDTTAKDSIALFGDSHAAMWLPAVVPWANVHKYKVVLLWERACPIAELPDEYSYLVQGFTGTSQDAVCNLWRQQSIALLRKLKPSLVLLGERTSEIDAEPSNIPFTGHQWANALTSTIGELVAPHIKVAVLEDVPWQNTSIPSCLAAYPTDVLQCATAYPNTSNLGQQTAEAQAAHAASVPFIKTIPWLCTPDDKVCSGQIGSFITYRDQNHLTASYAGFLARVMGDAISAALRS